MTTYASGVVVASFGDVYAIDAGGRTAWHAQLPAAGPVAWDVGQSGSDTEAKDHALRTLELSSAADDQAVKSAYRCLARATHPDRHPNDRTAAARFASVRRAYERLHASGEPTGARSGLGISLTVEFAGFDPTVTFLATGPGDTVIAGSSDGRVYHVDATGRLEEAQVFGDHPVRAARRPDGTLGVAACGNELLFVTDNRVVHGAPLTDEPRRMTMLGEDVVAWRREAIHLIDVAGRVRWSPAFAKPVTHVAVQGDTLVCVAGALVVFRRASARERHADPRVAQGSPARPHHLQPRFPSGRLPRTQTSPPSNQKTVRCKEGP